MKEDVLIIVLVIAIALYFLFIWVLKITKIKNGLTKKIAIGILAISISPYAYVGVWNFIFFAFSYHPTYRFDQNKWSSEIEERYKISEDIIESEMLIGKTREEVISVLGDDYYSYSDDHIGYNIGLKPGILNIDPHVLDVYFENDIVVKVNQHES